jgi:hypothetical protein
MPGQHMLTEQGLLGIGCDQFAFNGCLAMASLTRFLNSEGLCFLCFFGLAPNNFNSFIPLAAFLFEGQDSPTHQRSLANVDKA